MKGRYGIATNNIDPNSISTIQILENHQNIKALEDLRLEERASINLKLKSGVKGVYNLIATLGGGYDKEALWDNELITTYFQRNSQLLATYKGNNSGNDLETELRSFDDNSLSRTSSVTDIELPSVPGINKKYYYFNQSHTATYNHIFRVGENGELGINAAYLNDNDKRSNHATTTTILPDGSKNIVDEYYRGNLRRNLANGTITYLQNSEKSYIKEQLKFDWFSTDGSSDIYAGSDIAQNSDVENYRLHNLFHLTNRTNTDKGVDFASTINLEKRPHNLGVSTNLFPDVLLGDNMFQRAERRNFSTENHLDFLSALVWGNLQIHPTLFVDYSQDGLTSQLEDYRNDIHLSSLNTGVGIIANYRARKFYVDLQITGNYRYFDLNDRIAEVETDKHRFVVEPRLTVKYDINGSNELRLKGSLGHSNPAIENLYNQYILTSYRQLSVYQNNDLWNSNSTFNSGLNNSSIFSPNNMQSLNLNASSALYPQQNSFSTYSQPYQLAQNSLPNSGSDVEKLRQQTIQNVSKGITSDEGIVPYVYLDTMCKKTVGKGKNVNKWDIFRQGNYTTSDGTPANETEKLDCFNKFEQKTHELCDGKPVVDGKIINFAAPYFEDVCDLRISPQEIERLKNDHIEDDLKRWERHVNNLYSHPPEIVNEIENRLYNVGWGNLKKLDVIPILNDPQLTLEEKKKLLETRLYQGKISPKRLQDSQKRLQGN